MLVTLKMGTLGQKIKISYGEGRDGFKGGRRRRRKRKEEEEEKKNGEEIGEMKINYIKVKK